MLAYLEFLCAWIFSLATLIFIWLTYIWTRAIPQAEGRVRCIEKYHGIEGVWYTPIVEFVWEGETIILEQLAKYPWRPKMGTGSKVPLYFPPSSPSKARMTPVSIQMISVIILAQLLSIVVWTVVLPKLH